MRDQYESRPLFTCDAKQQVGDRFSCLSVQIAGRFICLYEIWLAGERARHSHALAFATRELTGIVIQSIRQTDGV